MSPAEAREVFGLKKRRATIPSFFRSGRSAIDFGWTARPPVLGNGAFCENPPGQPDADRQRNHQEQTHPTNKESYSGLPVDQKQSRNTEHE
jgi:hypothetical protein